LWIDFCRKILYIGWDVTLWRYIMMYEQPANNHEFITEPERKLQIAGRCDVLVAGGGPAGFAAALSAARNGAKTVLLEKNQCLGGIWTAGLMPWFIDFQNKTGIMQELCEALKQVGGYTARPNTFTAPPEEVRYMLEKLALDSGVIIQYGTNVCNAITADRRIEYVISESKSGRQAWQARFFIDATGDGDLAAVSGCSFEFGNSEKQAQPASLNALIGGVDPEKCREFFVSDANGKSSFLAVLQQAGITPSYTHPSLFHFGCGIVGLMSHHAYGVVPFDDRSLSQAIISGRAELHEQISLLKNVPGWENAVLLGTAANLGIREGRRVRGKATVSVDKLNCGEYPEDTVCIPKFCIDIHAPDPEKCTSVLQDRPAVGKRGYGIPLGALLSFDLDNLLMAGRCISGDFTMHASYRVTGNAVPMGEAAGWTAAEAVKNNIELENVKNIPCFSKN